MKTSRLMLCLVVLVLALAIPASVAQSTDLVETRYPISDARIGLWREGVPAADIDNFRFNEIDDPAAAHDGDATYIFTTAVKSFWAGVAALNLPADAIDISVSIIWTVRFEVEDAFHVAWPSLGVNGTYYIGTRHNPGTTYTTYTDTWTTDPSTGLAWTPETVSTVQGMGFDSNLATGKRVTQAYMQIEYDLGSAASIDVEKYVWDGTAWVDADEPPGPELSPGTDPQFRFVVTNDGNADLSNVDLTDNVYGDISLDGTLTAGASAEYLLTGIWAEGLHTNTATASGESGGSTYTDSDDANYYGVAPVAALTLVKTASPTTYSSVGDVIDYSYELVNSGDLILDGPFTVDDDKAGVTCPEAPGGLAPGESLVCTAGYVIALDDLSAGSVTNIAQGHAYYDGSPVDSNQDDETVTANEAQLGTALSKCVSMRDGLIAGTALEQAQVTYSGSETILYISGSTIYWTRFNDLSGTAFNMAVQQTVTSDYGFARYLGVRQLPADNVLLYDGNCRLVGGTISDVQGGTIDDATLAFTFTANNALSGGPYFLRVNYDHASLKNQVIGSSYPASGETLAHYDLATLLDGTLVAGDGAGSHTGGYGGLDLNRR